MKRNLQRAISFLLTLALVLGMTSALAGEVYSNVKVITITREQPTAEDTEDIAEVTEEPAIEETEEPIAEDPTEEPAIDETEEPAVEETTEEPTIDETEEPAVEDPTEEPAIDETEEPGEEEVPVEEELIEEEPTDEELTEVDEEASAFEFSRDEEGNLLLDENGDPIPVLQPDQEIPVSYERDEEGNLVLDEDGNPVVTEILPAGNNRMTSIYDLLDADRRIDIYVQLEAEEMEFGMHATLTAVLKGYDQVEYTLQWQTSKDNASWSNISGANGRSLVITATEENYMDYWRISVLMDDAQ